MNPYKNDYIPKIFEVYSVIDVKSSYIIEIQSGKQLKKIKFKKNDSIYFNPDQFELISLMIDQNIGFDITGVTYLNNHDSSKFIEQMRTIINDLNAMSLVDSLKKNDLYKFVYTNFQEEFFETIEVRALVNSLNTLIDFIIDSHYEITIMGV